MKKWNTGALVGIVWGATSLITLECGIWCHPLIAYTFGLPTSIAFPIADIWDSHVVLFLLAPAIGALIGAGFGYLIDRSQRAG